jgi:hypothetical protein
VVHFRVITKGFPPTITIDVVELLLMNPPYNVNGVEVEGILVSPIEIPHPMKGLGMEYGKSLLPTDGNDGGM